MHVLLNALYRVLVFVNLAGAAWLLYDPMFASVAARPGARDGTGLIFVGLFWLFVSAIVGVILQAVEVMLLKAVFPDWEPPEE